MSTTRGALALHAASRTTDALILLFNAVGVPDRAHPAHEEKQLLAQLLDGVALNSGNDVIHRVLLELLRDTAIDAQQVARAALGLVVASPEFVALERWSTVPDAEVAEAQLAPVLLAFPSLPLARALLPRVVLSESRVERVVTFARRALLAFITGETPAEPWHWEAVHLLAQSAFNGEYAWHEAIDEREFVDAAASHLSTWLAERSEALEEVTADGPAPMLLLYALYRRLTLLTHWKRLAQVPAATWEPFGEWIARTVAQHVQERLEERRLAVAMPTLPPPPSTDCNEASVRVRAMYEAHPYPRWTTPNWTHCSSASLVFSCRSTCSRPSRVSIPRRAPSAAWTHGRSSNNAARRRSGACTSSSWRSAERGAGHAERAEVDHQNLLHRRRPPMVLSAVIAGRGAWGDVIPASPRVGALVSPQSENVACNLHDAVWFGG